MFLGDLSIADLENRTGWHFSDSDRQWLVSHIQHNATIKYDSDKFHIFDIPFTITVAEGIKDTLIKMLTKYNNKQVSKESVQIAVITETEEEKAKRLKKEKEKREQLERLSNPNSIWNIKWHMLVPVKVKYNNKEIELYYGCFINTYSTGRDNIPEIIDGKCSIYLDDVGFHGYFNLYYSDIDNDADEHPEWNYVIGSNFYSLNGSYLSNIPDLKFETIHFSILNGIKLYESIRFTSCKEIHFLKYKEV